MPELVGGHVRVGSDEELLIRILKRALIAVRDTYIISE
jgi:hypothetical protein